MREFITLLLLLFIASTQADIYNFNQLVISQVIREYDIKGRCVESSLRITVRNEGNQDQQKFFYALPNELQGKAVTILMEKTEGLEVSGTIVNDPQIQSQYNATLYEFVLDQPIKPGKSANIRIKELYIKRWIPYPKAITLNEKQLVRFEDSKYFFTPYKSEKQKTTYKASIVQSYTEDSKSSQTQNNIQYGEFNDIPPFTRDLISLHVENNNPFPVLKKSEKTIQVSHWGNIGIEYYSQLYNYGANLSGEFGRVAYNKYTPEAGKNALKNIYAELPYHAWGAFYYDEIGNISTSKAWRDSKEKVVKLQLEPRFPILGGWRTNFYVGYNLNPSKYLYQDQNTGVYVLKQLFYIDLHDLVTEDFTLKVVLPEGAYDIKAELPFEVDDQSQEITYSYLDTIGRPTLRFNKKLVAQYHNQFFYVNYRLAPSDLMRKPLLLFSAFLSFFAVLIIINRVQLKTFSKEN